MDIIVRDENGNTLSKTRSVLDEETVDRIVDARLIWTQDYLIVTVELDDHEA